MSGKIMEIIEEEGTKLGVPSFEILGRRRTKRVVEARKNAIRRCRKETCYSLAELGEMFGGRDHTTILHHLK